MRKSKTLAQQARYYEVDGELEMMDLMWASWINGNFSTFKEYYHELCKKDRRRFIGFLYNQVEDTHEFNKMVDMLMFG